jgi:hypothetical protein
MYLPKVIPKAKKLRKKRFYVAVLKVTDEYSRIRISISDGSFSYILFSIVLFEYTTL